MRRPPVLEEEYGDRAAAIESNERIVAVDAAVIQTIERFAGIDVALNNARYGWIRLKR